MIPLRWLMELEEVKLNNIARNVPNQLVYSTILSVNIVFDEVEKLALRIE